MGADYILADLGRCEPSGCLTRRANQRGTWMLAEYETEPSGGSGIQGTMIYGAHRLDSPPLTLSLAVPAGWYKLFIATWHDIHVGGSHLRLKLNQDRYYRQLDPELLTRKDGNFPDHVFGPTDLTESFWRVAYLDNEKLHIDRVRTWTQTVVTAKPSDLAACLAYVRLAPATQTDQDLYFGRGRTQRPKILFAQYDNGNWWQVGCRTADDIRASLDCFRATDLTSLNWGCFAGEGACYPSKFAQRMGREPEVTACLEHFFSDGIDPLKVASDYAREIGLRLYPSLRIGGKRPQPALATTNETPFFDSHPQCLCRTRAGIPTAHYSFACEEVQAYFINVVRELVSSYDVPGIHFVFCRSNPFVLYEDVTVRAFQERYGVDPNALPEDDPRWQAHRAGYLTEFVRKLRAALDAVGQSRKKRMELSVSVPGNLRVARDFGVDGIRWASEGLVDYLILHNAGVLPLEDWRDYRRQLAGVKIPLIVDFYPRRLPAKARLTAASEYYRAGVDGFCFWDSEKRVNRAAEFAVMRWLGHHEDVAEWARSMENTFRVIPLKTLQGYTTDRRYWTLTSG